MGRYAVIAISSIYGVDIQEDNSIQCQDRLFSFFSKRYLKNYGTNCKIDYLKSIKFIIDRNILWGNALDFTNPESKKPIIFSEWRMVNGNMLKRRDYIFKFLVEKTHQFVLDFNDEGQKGAIDEPIKDYPPIHYLISGSEAILMTFFSINHF